MKKFLAILLAMTLCLVSFAAIAEEAAADDAEAEVTDEVAEEGDGAEDMMSVENTVSFEAQEVAIGETGLTLSIPADWVAATTPEGALCAFASADGSIAMTIALAETDLDTVWEQCTATIEAGTGKNVGEIEVNGIYYILYDAADGLTSAAYTSATDTQVLAIAFQAATADTDSTIAMEILGSLMGGEEAAE